MILNDRSIKIRTPFMLAEFDPGDSGFSRLWRTDIQTDGLLYTELNGISKEKYLLTAQSDSIIINCQGFEIYASAFEWVSYGLAMPATEVYGKQWQGAADTDINCVRCVTSTPYDLGLGRTISRIEHFYFPTMDGKGLVKKITVVVSRASEAVELINSVEYTNTVSACNGVLDRFSTTYRAIEGYRAGFNYNTLAALESEWTIDSGIAAQIARATVYPTLLPDFTDSRWQKSGAYVQNSTSNITLSATGRIRCWVKQPLPNEHDLALRFSVVSGTGQLRGRLGANRKLNDINYDVENTWSAAGTKTLRTTTGATGNAVFVELECVSGSFTLDLPVLQLQYDPDLAAVYDGSLLANTEWCNSIRISGSGLAGKRLMHTIPGQALNISQATALAMWILPLTTSSPIHAFRYILVDENAVEHYTDDLSIWVDINETYPNTPGRWNYWDEGMYDAIVPAGVTMITAIGIEILTNEAIDWQLDNLFVYGAVTSDIGLGATTKSRFGLNPPATRQSESCQSTYLVASLATPEIVTEKIQIYITHEVTWYAEKSPLTYGVAVSPVAPSPLLDEFGQPVLDENGDPVYITNWAGYFGQQFTPDFLAIYALVEQTTATTWVGGLINDLGGKATFTLPAGTVYPVEVKNLTTGLKCKVIRYDQASRTVTFQTSSKTMRAADAIQFTYVEREVVDPSNYFLTTVNSSANGLQPAIGWQDTAYVYNNDRRIYYCEYRVATARPDPHVALQLCGDHNVRHLVKNSAEINSGLSKLALEMRVVLGEFSNTVGRATVCFYPHLNPASDAALDDACEQVYHEVRDLTYNSRLEPITPAPRNWNIAPHFSYNGEFVASDAMGYLDLISERVGRGHISNCILSGGSMSAIKSRLRGGWFGWDGALKDYGISMVDMVRNIIRRGYAESTIGDNLSGHRYWIELTMFNAKWIMKHRDQVAYDTGGASRLKRVWVYTPDDLSDDQYVVQYAWDDMSPDYYLPQLANGKTYSFAYHYIQNYPAFWSTVTPGSVWGPNVVTMYDLWKIVAEEYCTTLDCEGIIMSEMIQAYSYACSDNDFILYNQYRIAQGLGVAADWPRRPDGKIRIDDAGVWDWKCWQVEQAVTALAAVVRGHGKLFGISAEHEPIIAANEIDAPVWDGFTKLDGHVRELTYNNRRYGTDYRAMLRHDRADVLYVWLYYRYAPLDWSQEQDGTWSHGLIDDFIAAYSDIRERLLVCIGAYPSSNLPETNEEMRLALEKLIRAGFNVAYAGFPKTVTWQKFDAMWDWFSLEVPSVRYNQVENWIGVDPKQYGGLPFYVRS